MCIRDSAGADHDNNAAVLTLNHSNDRGLALYGGRSSGDRSWIALRSIDSNGRVSNAIEIRGGNGQGVQDLRFYTGESTSTTERLRINSGGDVSISSDGTVHGVSKLTIKPANRTTAFAPEDGDTWHDVVIKHEGNATNNAVGLAFEVSGDAYHKNAGTGIAAVKQGTASDYGSDLVFITRGQSTAATEKLRITSAGRLGIGDDNPASLLSLKASNPTIRFTDGSTLVGAIEGDTTQNTFYGYNGADIVFSTTSGASYADRLRIDSSGRIQMGSDTSNLGAAKFNIVTGGDDGISLGRLQGANVSSGDVLGTIAFQSAIGSQTTNSAEASIKAIAAENSSGSTAATSFCLLYTSPSPTRPY